MTTGDRDGEEQKMSTDCGRHSAASTEYVYRFNKALINETIDIIWAARTVLVRTDRAGMRA